MIKTKRKLRKEARWSQPQQYERQVEVTRYLYLPKKVFLVISKIKSEMYDLMKKAGLD